LAQLLRVSGKDLQTEVMIENNSNIPRRVVDVIGPECKKHLESQNISIVDHPSIGAAFARGDFLFVYISNGFKKSSYYGDKVFCLFGADTNNFLMDFGKTALEVELINQKLREIGGKK
jgi:hypothetical protein